MINGRLKELKTIEIHCVDNEFSYKLQNAKESKLKSNGRIFSCTDKARSAPCSAHVVVVKQNMKKSNGRLNET